MSSSLENVGFFQTIQWHNAQHPMEKLRWMGRLVEWYFDFGQRSYTVIGNGEENEDFIPVVQHRVEKKFFATVFKICLCFVKAISWLTVFTPGLLLIMKCLYRTNNEFKRLVSNQENLDFYQNFINGIDNQNCIDEEEIWRTYRQNCLDKIRKETEGLLSEVFSAKSLEQRIESIDIAIDNLTVKSRQDLRELVNLQRTIQHQAMILQRFCLDKISDQIDEYPHLTKAIQKIVFLDDKLTSKFFSNTRVKAEYTLIEKEIKKYRTLHESSSDLVEDYAALTRVLGEIYKSNDFYDNNLFRRVTNYLTPSAIVNLGNSCYINADLQLLLSIPFFKNLITKDNWKPSWEVVREEGESEEEFRRRRDQDVLLFENSKLQLSQLKEIFHEFCRVYAKNDTGAIKKVVKKFRDEMYKAGMIEGGIATQQVADRLLTELMSAAGYTLRTRRYETETIDGKIRNIVRRSSYKEPMLSLRLKDSRTNEPFSRSFQGIVDNEFTVKIEGSEIQGKKVISSYVDKLEEAPEYIPVMLLRFGNDLKKVGDAFVFDKGEVIDFTKAMADHVIEKSDKKAFLYEPVGLVQHHGVCANGGHYTADVKKGGQWYHCNDNCIKAMGGVNTNLSEGFIYMFKRVNIKSR